MQRYHYLRGPRAVAVHGRESPQCLAARARQPCGARPQARRPRSRRGDARRRGAMNILGGAAQDGDADGCIGDSCDLTGVCVRVCVCASSGVGCLRELSIYKLLLMRPGDFSL